MSRGFLAATATSILLATTAAQAADPLKIGVTATLEGTYTVLGEDGMRGFEVALRERQQDGRRPAARDHRRLDRREPRLGRARGRASWSSRTRSRS